MLKIILVIGVLIVGVAAFSGTSTDGTGEVSPTPTATVNTYVEATRKEVATITDCDRLQVMHDASWAAHQRFSDEEPKNLDMMLTHTQIMEIVSERMTEINCE